MATGEGFEGIQHHMRINGCSADGIVRESERRIGDVQSGLASVEEIRSRTAHRDLDGLGKDHTQ